MKYLKFIILPITLIVGLFCQSYVREVQKQLKIEHVYNRPSDAYGPGTVVYYTKKSGYTLTCWPWITLGTTRNNYESKIEISNIIGMDVESEATLNFDIDLNAEDKGKIKSEYHNITKMRLELTNGKQYDPLIGITAIYNNIKNPRKSCYQDIQTRMRFNNGKGEVYLVLATYGYDMDYTIKTESGWKSAAEVPKDVLKVLAAKIKIDTSSTQELKLTGKQVYIGFNGDPLPVDESFDPSQKNARELLRIHRALNITEIIRM